MKREYMLTREQAVKLATELLKMSARYRRWHRLVVVAAVVIACAFSLYKPPTVSINGNPAPLPALALAVCLQIPAVALLIYLIFRLALDTPIRVVARLLQRQPKESWFSRTLEVVNGEVTLRCEHTSRSYKAAYVDGVVETANGLHLMHGAQALLSVPRMVCGREELLQALRQETEQGAGSGTENDYH